jgi:hypothetical protein
LRVLRVELRALFLLGKCSTTWDMPPTLFAVVRLTELLASIS